MKAKFCAMSLRVKREGRPHKNNKPENRPRPQKRKQAKNRQPSSEQSTNPKERGETKSRHQVQNYDKDNDTSELSVQDVPDEESANQVLPEQVASGASSTNH